VVEQFGIAVPLDLWAEHANVQTAFGRLANLAGLFSCLRPALTILTMNLAHGGPLTTAPRELLRQAVPRGVITGLDKKPNNRLRSVAVWHGAKNRN